MPSARLIVVLVAAGLPGAFGACADRAPADSLVREPRRVATTTATPRAGTDQWLAVLRHIAEVTDRAYAEARPELVASVYDDACECLGRATSEIARLAAVGQRYVGKPLVIEAARLFSWVGPDLVVLRVRQRQDPPNHLVDRSGRQIGSDIVTPTVSVIYSLRRVDGAWKVTDLIEEGPPE